MDPSGITPFRSYASVLEERFGERVFKVGLDAHLTCPNIDGSVARGGCSFCTNPSFSFQPMSAAERIRDIGTQLRHGIDFYRRRRGARRFIAYFQTFTNTWAPIETLRSLWSQALDHEEVVGLAISTRPDAVGEPVLDLLEEFAGRTHLTVELGLQTANDATLRAINRGHTLEQFRDAMARLARRRLEVKVHLLFGLPGDGPDDALRSVREVNASGAAGVKLHHLQVLRGTRLGREYLERPFPVFTFESYRALLLDAIAHLDPRLYVDRLFATCRRELVIAPQFDRSGNELRSALVAAMREAGVTQGCALAPDPMHAPGLVRPLPGATI